MRGGGFVGFDQEVQKRGELLQVFGVEGGQGWGWAQQDGVGSGDGDVAGGGERDQLAASVVGVGSTFDQAVGLELVDDERGVRGVKAVGLGELGQRRRSVPELEEDLPRPAPRPNPSAAARSLWRLWEETNRCIRAQARSAGLAGRCLPPAGGPSVWLTREPSARGSRRSAGPAGHADRRWW